MNVNFYYMPMTVLSFFRLEILKLYLRNSAQNWNIAVNGLLTIGCHCILVKHNVFCLVREENPEKFMILRLNAIGTQ